MTFADRLDDAIQRTGTPCVVGIDPHLELLPPSHAAAADLRRPRAERAALLQSFCLELLDAVAGKVPAVKPQSAFFELLGADGVRAWETVVRAAREAGLLVIGDIKRGDISTSADAYAHAYLSTADASSAPCDAVTVNPLLGSDSVRPFLEACKESRSGVFLLVLTSNPSSAEFQQQGSPTLSERIAAAVDRWGCEITGSSGMSSVGAVVGATHPETLSRMRSLMPRAPFLLPGYGAQGASARDIGAAFLPGARGALVSSSRGVAFAYRMETHKGKHWKDAARDALDGMIADVAAAVGRPRRPPA